MYDPKTKKHNQYKMIVLGLSKQWALDTDPKTVQQINFSQNLDLAATMFFIIEEVK